MLIYWLFKLLLQDPMMFLAALAVLIFPLLISITIHEWAHGMTAYKFGDPTPKDQGRLTLNPFAHLDLVGTLMLFIIGIGWAKPVQINPDNIPGKTKQMLVALAGPGSNFALAILFTIILYGLNQYIDYAGIDLRNSLAGMFAALVTLVIQINVILGLFNMLPIPPLDGSNVLRWLMPDNIANLYMRLAPFGMIILLLLLFTVGFRFIFDASRVVSSYIYRVVELVLNPIIGIF